MTSLYYDIKTSGCYYYVALVGRDNNRLMAPAIEMDNGLYCPYAAGVGVLLSDA
jgi:hypothetical protein